MAANFKFNTADVKKVREELDTSMQHAIRVCMRREIQETLNDTTLSLRVRKPLAQIVEYMEACDKA